MRILPFVLVLATAFQTTVLRAEPKDIAELFPAGTLVYVEVNKPAETSKQLAAFFKGSALENALPAIDKIRDKHPNDKHRPTVSTLVGPEMLKEAARFKACAAGITGFGKLGEPEWAAVLLTGDSQLPGMLMRAFLSANPGVRKTATVDGVDLYQERSVSFDDPLVGQLGTPERDSKPSGLAFAYQPGIVLIGSSRDSASAVIRRYKEKEKSVSLAATALFNETNAQREPAGLFLFADVGALQKSHALPDANGRSPEPFATVLLRKLLPPSGAHRLTARLELTEQGIDLRCSLKLDRNAKCPLADLLAGPALRVADLNGLIKEAPLACTLNLPADGQRLSRLLAVLDLAVTATGTLGPCATEILNELEQKKIVSSAALAKLNRISVVMPPFASWPKGGMPLPVILVHAGAADSLDELSAAIPAILELLGGQKADAVTETIDGVKIRSLEAKASPTGAPIHFAQHGKTLALGGDRQTIAACLLNEPRRSMASIEEVAETVNGSANVVFAGMWNWAAMLQPVSSKKEPDNARKSGREPNAIVREPGAANGMSLPPEIFARLQGMPPLTFTIGRQDDEIRLEVRQRDSQKLRAKFVDHWFEWFAASGGRGGYRRSQTMEIDGPNLVPPPAP